VAPTDRDRPIYCGPRVLEVRHIAACASQAPAFGKARAVSLYPDSALQQDREPQTA